MDKKITLACFLGISLEWYEFGLFGVFSPVIARLFFPPDETTIALLKTLVIFTIGFLLRPVASVFWGYLGDKIGRKTTALWSMFLIGFSTMAIGLLPDYQQAGYVAPMLLLVVRAIQGFSVSGEHGPMIAYLYETGQGKETAFIGMSAVYFGLAMGVLAEISIQQLASDESFYAWGWRIPFIVGGMIAVVGWVLRRQMHESEAFTQYVSHVKKRQPWLPQLRQTKGRWLLGVGVAQVAFTVPYMVFIYALSHQGSLNSAIATNYHLSTFISLLITSVAIGVVSLWAAQYGRRQCMGVGIIGLLLLAPMLVKSLFFGHIEYFFAAQIIFGLLAAMIIGPFCSYFSSLFSIGIRCSSLSITLNVASALFGGTTPLIIAWFFGRTDDPLWNTTLFVLGSSLLSLLCLTVIKKHAYEAKSSDINHPVSDYA